MHHHEQLLWRDERRYIAHPHLACLADGTWLLIATSGPRRATVLHPPLDPEFIGIGMRSHDEGRTWSTPVPVPAHGHSGTECGGLTALTDGGVLLNQWRFRWYAANDAAHEPVTPAAALRAEFAASTELDGSATSVPITWARGGGTATIWHGSRQGREWSDPVVLDVAPYVGGYGLRGGVVYPDGEIVLPLCDVPDYARVFLVRSRDGGRSWSAAEPVAAVAGLAFEEPASLAFPDGRLLLLMRENTHRRLYVVRSEDRGASWSEPRPAGLEGYPADLVHLGPNRIAAVSGVRRPHGAIHVAVSDDGGDSWTPTHQIEVAGDPDTQDLGYPTAAATREGGLFVAYYRRDREGVTALHGRRIDFGNN